jgi:hypothetical protein
MQLFRSRRDREGKMQKGEAEGAGESHSVFRYPDEHPNGQFSKKCRRCTRQSGKRLRQSSAIPSSSAQMLSVSVPQLSDAAHSVCLYGDSGAHWGTHAATLAKAINPLPVRVSDFTDIGGSCSDVDGISPGLLAGSENSTDLC